MQEVLNAVGEIKDGDEGEVMEGQLKRVVDKLVAEGNTKVGGMEWWEKGPILW